MLILLACFLICFLSGILVYRSHSKVVGKFVINETDPQAELFKIIFSEDLMEFENEDYIRFKIVKK